MMLVLQLLQRTNCTNVSPFWARFLSRLVREMRCLGVAMDIWVVTNPPGITRSTGGCLGADLDSCTLGREMKRGIYAADLGSQCGKRG